MRALQSCWLGGVTAAAVLVGVLYVACSTVPQYGWGGGPSEGERLDRLEADRQHLERRRAFIRSLVDDLVEGRLNLRQAASAWRAENLNSPPHLRMHTEYLPGATEEERYGRSVLWHAKVVLAGDARHADLLARLGAEAESLASASAEVGPPLAARGGRRLPLPSELPTKAEETQTN